MLGISNHHKKAVAVVDVGSGSVGMGVALVGSTGPAELILAERGVLSLEHRTPEHIASDVTGLLASVGGKVFTAYTSDLQKQYGRIRTAEVVIRAPWTRSASVSAESRFKEDVHITQQTIADLAQEALKKATEIEQSALLEANVVRVELNGYATANPTGKKAHSIAVRALVSDVDVHIRQMVSEHIQRLCGVQEPTIRSGTRAMLSMIREHSDISRSALILDLTGEATNVIVMRKGISVEHALIPVGTRSILERVAGNKLPDEIMGTIRMISSDECHSAACEEALTSLAHVENDLVKEFGEVFNTLVSTRRLPNDCLLVVHPDMAQWLAHFFGRIDFSQFTMTAQPLEVKILSIDDLKEGALAASGVPQDMGLLIVSALVNSEMQHKE
jgi:hypothetical protein